MGISKWFFKTPENKAAEQIVKIKKLTEEASELNTKCENVLNTLCLLGQELVIFRYFFVKNNTVYLLGETAQCMRTKTTMHYPVVTLELRYGNKYGDILQIITDARMKWLNIKADLEAFGVEIENSNELKRK